MDTPLATPQTTANARFQRRFETVFWIGNAAIVGAGGGAVIGSVGGFVGSLTGAVVGSVLNAVLAATAHSPSNLRP